MKQYLLAVHGVEGEPAPPEAQMQQTYKAVAVFKRGAPVGGGLGVRWRPAPYDAAIARTANRAERSFLTHCRDSL